MKVIQIPALQDNYIYLAICEKTGKTAVVDAPDAPLVRQAIKREKLELVAILNTHHHYDHIGANEDLLSKQKLDVYGSFYDRDRIPGITNILKENDEVKIGSMEFRVMEAFGHTLGHILYYSEVDGVLFCGDTLFVAGCGRLFEGTPEQMFASLAKIKLLPPDTLIYCAHEYSQINLEFALILEPDNLALQNKYENVVNARQKGLSTVPTTLREELEYNPFLRAESVSEFARIRQLRNDF